MKTNQQHEGISGIYCIRNLVNNKVYIGKSLNIRQRIYAHIGGLNSKNKKKENQYFINSWWKYGKENFEYFILEIIDKNTENFESIIKEKELFWMDIYKSTDENYGYNLRRDSSTNMICHEKTREKMTESHKKRFENPEERIKTGIKSKKFWEENSEIKENMKLKLSNLNTKYEIHQYSKDGQILVKVWKKIIDIVSENPSYKKHNIYSCCSGAKPSMYGFKWIKVLKDDIVQTELKDSD